MKSPTESELHATVEACAYTLASLVLVFILLLVWDANLDSVHQGFLSLVLLAAFVTYCRLVAAPLAYWSDCLKERERRRMAELDRINKEYEKQHLEAYAKAWQKQESESN